MRCNGFWVIPFFALTLLVLSSVGISSRPADDKREFISVVIGFYNVENLFDTINDPDIRDDDWTPQGSNRWNTGRYVEKLENLSEVIEQLGQELNPDGPAVLGLSEVENTTVLEDLARQERIKDRNYQVVHETGPDRRGMDVAFLYNPTCFEYIGHKAYPTVIEDRPDFFTRDQLLLTGKFLGERMHFIVAHWPSRVGGEARSRPLRSRGSKEGIRDDELFNPYESLYQRGIGTNAWRDAWSLFDQILLTPSLLNDDYSDFKYLRAEVFNRPFLRQPSGRFQGYPFRTFGGGVYLGGYSDHFPVYVFLIREHKKE